MATAASIRTSVDRAGRVIRPITCRDSIGIFRSWLEQALAERRKADALVAEKKRLEEEAQRNPGDESNKEYQDELPAEVRAEDGVNVTRKRPGPAALLQGHEAERKRHK